MLQLTIGYLVGRIAIAAVLLPGYFRGELNTAYAAARGPLRPAAPVASRPLIFLVTRAFADSVRVFAAAIPISLITGLPYWQSIVITGVLTLIYTYYGGLRAVVWVDVIQMGIYLIGGVAALVVLLGLGPGGWDGIVAAAEPLDKFRVFHFEGGWGGFASSSVVLDRPHRRRVPLDGVARRGPPDRPAPARSAIPRATRAARSSAAESSSLASSRSSSSSASASIAFYQGRAFDTPDAIFPTFIIEQLPPGLSGLIIAGILAAMMSTVSSSLNSLASATTHDLYAPLSGRADDEEHLMRVGKRFTLLWAGIIIGGGILFQFASQGTPIVVIALQIASFTYGGLLGAFLLAAVSRRAEQRDAITGMAAAIVVMTVLWAAQQFGLMPRVVDTLWFALIGSTLTVVVGSASAALRGGRGAREEPEVVAGAESRPR